MILLAEEEIAKHLQVLDWHLDDLNNCVSGGKINVINVHSSP